MGSPWLVLTTGQQVFPWACALRKSKSQRASLSSRYMPTKKNVLRFKKSLHVRNVTERPTFSRACGLCRRKALLWSSHYTVPIRQFGSPIPKPNANNYIPSFIQRMLSFLPLNPAISYKPTPLIYNRKYQQTLGCGFILNKSEQTVSWFLHL